MYLVISTFYRPAGCNLRATTLCSTFRPAGYDLRATTRLKTVRPAGYDLWANCSALRHVGVGIQFFGAVRFGFLGLAKIRFSTIKNRSVLQNLKNRHRN